MAIFAKYNQYRPHARVTLEPEGDSMTRQEFAEESDINELMRRYKKSGILPSANKPPMYLDLSATPNFQEAMNMMIAAEAAFMSLPSDVRKTFDNDPAEFVKFASEADNLGQMREWGLAPPEKAPEAPMRVEVVNPPEAPPAPPKGP